MLYVSLSRENGWLISPSCSVVSCEREDQIYWECTLLWQVNIQTAAQHAELMRKVETLNLLQDSNHLLRDERNRLGDRLQEIEAKVLL